MCQSFTEMTLEQLLSPEGTTLSLNIHQLLTQACDGIQKYVLRNPVDAQGLNLLGLLYEREGLIQPSVEIMRYAISAAVSTDNRSCVLVNLARVLRYSN